MSLGEDGESLAMIPAAGSCSFGRRCRLRLRGEQPYRVEASSSPSVSLRGILSGPPGAGWWMFVEPREGHPSITTGRARAKDERHDPTCLRPLAELWVAPPAEPHLYEPPYPSSP